MEPIPVDTLDADHKLFDMDHVMMRHGSELFDLDQLDFAYQGSVRGGCIRRGAGVRRGGVVCERGTDTAHNCKVRYEDGFDVKMSTMVVCGFHAVSK